MTGRWQLLLLAAIALICVSLAQTAQGHRLLGFAGIYEKPATYTELAFTAPGALANTLPVPNARVKVSFSIHNVSNDARAYDWSILLVHSGVSKVKATGAVLTAAQGRTTVTKSVVPGCTGGRVQIVVRLSNPAQSISFWMICPSAPGKPKTSH